MDLQGRTLLLQQLPLIIAQAVKSMEKIDSIRIFQVGGLGVQNGTQNADGAVSGSSSNATFPDKLLTQPCTIK